MTTVLCEVETASLSVAITGTRIGVAEAPSSHDVAVTTYVDDRPELVTELAWLYRSWLYSCASWASDLVIFHHPAIAPERLPDGPGVIRIPLAPLSERDPTWADYPFINSVWFPTTPEAGLLGRYAYVLRTDGDCFLTSRFAGWRPRLATFGGGLFATEPAVAIRLAEIGGRWGIPTIANNVGSTIMAHGALVRHYSRIQLDYCRRLKAEEFANSNGAWPGWWFGVLSMYAGQLAAASVFGCGMTPGGLDVDCRTNAEIGPNDYHIHAWHTHEYFSKHAWRRGEYRGRDRAQLDPRRIADYCLYCAGPGPD